MKTENLNPKLKFLIMLMLPLIFIGSIAFGQTSLAPLQKEFNDKQEYGDSTIVDLVWTLSKGKLSVEIHNTDEVLIEVISVTHQTGKEPVIERTADFKKGELVELAVTTTELYDVYIRTTEGVTSLNILSPTSQHPGYFLINGKLDFKFTKNHLLHSLGGTSPDRFKDVANWKWDESLIDQ